MATVDSLIVSNTQFLFTTKKIIIARTKENKHKQEKKTLVVIR